MVDYELYCGDLMPTLQIKDISYPRITIYPGSDFVDHDQVIGVSVVKITKLKRLFYLDEKNLADFVEKADKYTNIKNFGLLNLGTINKLRILEGELIASGGLIIPKGYAYCEWCAEYSGEEAA